MLSQPRWHRTHRIAALAAVVALVSACSVLTTASSGGLSPVVVGSARAAQSTAHLTSGQPAAQSLRIAAPQIVTRAAGAGQATDPVANIPESPAYPTSCQSQPTSQTCQDSGIAALNHARATMGLGPYDLPDNFESLPQLTQLVVLSNLDRAVYGLAPILGTTTALNAIATTGANTDVDPTGLLGLVNGLFYNTYRSNWAAGWASAIYTYYEWMYDDGLGSSNIDCTILDQSGCWGHRDNTLATFPTTTIVMGVATAMSPLYHAVAYTELYQSISSGTPTYLPTVIGVTQQQASTTVHITGLGLAGATSVTINGVSVPYTINSYSSIDAVAPDGSQATVVVATSDGASIPMQAPALVAASPAGNGSYESITPARLIDTRKSAPIAGLGSITVPVAGQGNVPTSGVAAVVLNVTAASPTASGFLTVWPSGQPRPITSSVNYRSGVTVANLVMMPLGNNGSVDIYNASGTKQNVVVDVFGYYVGGSGAPTEGFGAVAPSRILDSRTGAGLTPATPAKVAAGATIAVQATGVGGVPTDGVAAVVINVTVTGPAHAGYVTVWADQTPRPSTSNLNFAAGQVVPNLVVAPVGDDGEIDIFNGSGGTLDVVGDVAGYYLDGPGGSADMGGTFSAVTPTRLLDTRNGLGAPLGPVGPATPVQLQVTGLAAVPSANVCAVALNVTSVQPTTGVYVTAWADATARPITSNLNVSAGQIVANLVIAPIGDSGIVDLYVSSNSSNLVADVMGYFSCTS